MTHTLHDYQVVARDFLRDRGRAALFMKMGLGKTASSLSALGPEHLPALVIAPKRVAASVWPAEVRKWRPDLTISVSKGDAAARMRVLQEDRDIIAMGRDNMNDLRKLKRDVPFKTLILDELSGFKTRRTTRWKMARWLIFGKGRSIDYVWGLTGTPSPNGLMDLWPQIYLLDEGKRLGRTLTAYRQKYFRATRQLPNGVVTEWELREDEGAEQAIWTALDDIALAMKTEGRVDVHEIILNEVQVEFTPKVRKIYKAMKKDLVVDLEMLGGEIHTAANAATLSNRLQQISAGFIYVDDADLHDMAWQELHRVKIAALQEIIEGINGSPILVFYRYKPELEMLRETFGDRLETPDDEDVIERWNAREIPVLAAHPASAGHGLNLQFGGNDIAWMTLPWSLEEWEQGNGRLARQGQTEQVVAHLILTKSSVDYTVLDRLGGKSRVQDRLLEHLESPI